MLENINSQIKGLSSTVKNKLSFNKIIETQIPQITATIPTNNSEKTPGQPEISHESVNMMTTELW